jgi:hypothetical protein
MEDSHDKVMTVRSRIILSSALDYFRQEIDFIFSFRFPAVRPMVMIEFGKKQHHTSLIFSQVERTEKEIHLQVHPLLNPIDLVSGQNTRSEREREKERNHRVSVAVDARTSVSDGLK